MVGQQCKMSLKFNSKEWVLQFSLNSCSTIALTSFVVFFHPPLSCHNHTPTLLSTVWKRQRKSLFLPPLPGSNLSLEWLLQCGHGTSCHMGDLISVSLGRNQLPPKTSREHDDYCFSLITVLISKVAAHCEGPFAFYFGTNCAESEQRGEQSWKRSSPKCTVSEEMIWLPDCLVGLVLSLEQMCDYKCQSFITAKWLTVSNARSKADVMCNCT